MYIGITSCRISKRWGHEGSGYKTQTYFWRAIRKYGWDQFEHIVFAEYLTEDEACNMEKLLIKTFKTNDPKFGYNYEAGGRSMDGATKRKIAEAETGSKHRYFGQHRSEDVRQKISQALSGEKHPCYGKHLSETTKQRISDSTKGRVKAPNAGTQPKPVVCVETGEVYPSTAEAARATGIHHTAITMVLTGRRHKAGDLHWQYYHTLEHAS